MATISTRNTVAAIVKETTEGVLVAPTLGTQFVAIQDGFTIDPAFETLENAEIKSSLAAGKPIIGSEAPSASLDHYLRASGVVATEPSYGVLLESALGAKDIAAVEHDTVSGSTVSVLNVGSGEGAAHPRGTGLLIKDATNGFRIRAVDSRSADALTLSFNLPTAPASGVNLGRSVTYLPVSDGHPTVSLWQYLGNKGAIQAVAGGRVVSASFTAEAGQLVNGSYSIEGVKYYFDPMIVTSTTNKVQFDIGAGNVTATIPVGIYDSPSDLASAVLTAIQAAAAGTYTVTYNNSTGRYTVTKSTGTLDIDWLTGTDSIGALMGFTADDTGALTYTSDSPVNFAAPVAPVYDSADPLAAKNHEVMMGTATEFACIEASSISFEIAAPKSDKLSICSTSGKAGSIVSSREVTVNLTAPLNEYDANYFKKFKGGEEVRFQYSFGVKEGGNWVAGKCGYLYLATATISTISVTDADGLAQVEMTLTGFANNTGAGEAYVGFL